MRFRVLAPILAVTLLAAGLSSAKDSSDQKREKSRKMAAQTLQDLYKLQPTSKTAIEKSAGYAVFNNMGMHLENDNALARFLDSGWSGSAQADAAAKAGKSGGAFSGAVEVSPGVWVYQITKDGLALQLTLQGTKYYKDGDLNKSQT